MFCLCNIALTRIEKTCVSFVDQLVFSCVFTALVYLSVYTQVLNAKSDKWPA